MTNFNEVGAWIRLIVGFQSLMVISPTASWIRWCMQVYACELMWTCPVWAERSTPDSFWVPSHRFNSATGEQKLITQTIYTDFQPASRLPNSVMPGSKLRIKPPNCYVFGVTRSGIEPRPPAPRADTLTTVLRRGGGYYGGHVAMFMGIASSASVSQKYQLRFIFCWFQ